MTPNEKLYEEALDAVRALHGDTSVGRETTLNRLTSLREELNVLIRGLEEDLELDE